MPSEFDVRTETTPAGVLVVRITGELDLATVPRLEETLVTVPAGSRVVIDLGACTLLDSSGVRVLAEAARVAEEGGGRLDLVIQEDSGIARVLEITSMSTLVRVHHSLDAAL